MPGRIGEEQRLRFQKQRHGEQATGELERTDESAREYAAACLQAAQELDVPVVSLWSEMERHPNWKALLSDGVHFNPQGNQYIANCVIRAMESHYPELAVTPDLSLTAQLGDRIQGKSFTRGSVSHLPVELPFMMEINPADHKQSFRRLPSCDETLPTPDH